MPRQSIQPHKNTRIFERGAVQVAVEPGEYNGQPQVQILHRKTYWSHDGWSVVSLNDEAAEAFIEAASLAFGDEDDDTPVQAAPPKRGRKTSK